MPLARASLAAAVAAAVIASAAAGGGAAATIVTIAGTGAAGFSGDRPQATAVSLNHPRGLAVTPDGSFLVAEAFGHTVSRVYPDGTIATVVGTGVAGYGGDGGPALAAQLNQPHAIALLPDGGFLIADNLNHRIRSVSPAGVVTTIAGNGFGGYAGDGGPATAAELRAPHGVALLPDGGFLIADTDNNRIRRVAPDGTISTVAGTGDAGFAGDGGPATAAVLNRPFGISPTPDGGFLIADTSNHRIRRVAPDGTISTVAGTGVPGYSGDGGPAVNAQIFTPHNVFALPDGSFVIADADNNRIRRVAPDGTITTIAGNGVAGFAGDGGDPTLAELNQPKAVVPFRGGFLIADSENHRVRLVAPNASGVTVIQTVAGNGVADIHGGRGEALAAKLNHPYGVSGFGSRGILVADTFNNRVRRIFPDGTITTVAGIGVAGFKGDGGSALSAQLRSPNAVAAAPGGAFLVADTLNNRIRRIAPDGTISTVAGTGARGFGGDGGDATAAQLSRPRGVASLPGGAFLIADTGNNRVRRVSPTGRITTIAGTGVAGYSGDGGRAVLARLRLPFAVAPLPAGGFVVADTANRCIRRVFPNGKIVTAAGTCASAKSPLPEPVAVVGLRGDAFLVADGSTNAVLRFAGSARPVAVAGSAATAGGLNRPHGVAVLADGSVVIANSGSNKILVLSGQA